MAVSVTSRRAARARFRHPGRGTLPAAGAPRQTTPRGRHEQSAITVATPIEPARGPADDLVLVTGHPQLQAGPGARCIAGAASCLHFSDRQKVVYAAAGCVSMPTCWNRVCMPRRKGLIVAGDGGPCLGLAAPEGAADAGEDGAITWSRSASRVAMVRAVWGVCVPKTSSTSCDQAIFVDHAIDASVSSDAVSLQIDRFG